MEIELLEKDKNSIKVKIKEADMTLISPLVKTLLEDEEVSEVKYTAGTPHLEHPTLYVRVKGGKPQTALKRASKSLANEIKEAREALEKQLK
jgi:DNA-directed RNA polymerase subunit L